MKNLIFFLALVLTVKTTAQTNDTSFYEVEQRTIVIYDSTKDSIEIYNFSLLKKVSFKLDNTFKVVFLGDSRKYIKDPKQIHRMINTISENWTIIQEDVKTEFRNFHKTETKIVLLARKLENTIYFKDVFSEPCNEINPDAYLLFVLLLITILGQIIYFISAYKDFIKIGQRKPLHRSDLLAIIAHLAIAIIFENSEDEIMQILPHIPFAIGMLLRIGLLFKSRKRVLFLDHESMIA